MILKKNNIHIYHLTQIFLINMTLKWYYINMLKNLIVFLSVDMVFGSIDYDRTLQ
jgi:hypothetical protein